MTKYNLNETSEFPYYIVDIEVEDMELLLKLEDTIKKTIKEHYGWKNYD